MSTSTAAHPEKDTIIQPVGGCSSNVISSLPGQQNNHVMTIQREKDCRPVADEDGELYGHHPKRSSSSKYVVIPFIYWKSPILRRRKVIRKSQIFLSVFAVCMCVYMSARCRSHHLMYEAEIWIEIS